MSENYRYPPETSWLPRGWWRDRLRSRRVWKISAVVLCIAGPIFGFLGFWIAFAVGMRSFGPSSDPDMLELLALFTRFPLPHRHSIPLIVLNSVFWAACFSLLIGILLGRTPVDEAKQRDPPAGAV